MTADRHTKQATERKATMPTNATLAFAIIATLMFALATMLAFGVIL